jgi:hypothetical protein
MRNDFELKHMPKRAPLFVAADQHYAYESRNIMK